MADFSKEWNNYVIWWLAQDSLLWGCYFCEINSNIHILLEFGFGVCCMCFRLIPFTLARVWTLLLSGSTIWVIYVSLSDLALSVLYVICVKILAVGYLLGCRRASDGFKFFEKENLLRRHWTRFAKRGLHNERIIVLMLDFSLAVCWSL